MRAVARHGVKPREKVGEPAKRLFRLPQARPREIELLAIVGRQQQIPHGRRPVPLGDHVWDRVGVAERLRHLLLVHDQVLDVNPEARERFAGRALALRDLVFVMRKNQIDAAGVNIDRRFAQQAQRHRRTLDVPAGAASGHAGVRKLPRRLAVALPLPQDEVAGVFLRVVVGIDARARLHALGVETRQLSITGERRDLEVDRPVAAVGVSVGVERRDHLGHGAQVRLVGRARILFHRLEAERLRVLAERRDVLVRVGAQFHAGLLSAGNRSIVDIGEVDHLLHAVAEEVLQRSAQNIHADEGAEVADVAARVGGQPAGVDADRLVGAGFEVLLTARERVIQPHRGHGRGRDARHSPPPSHDTSIRSSPALASNRTTQGRSAIVVSITALRNAAVSSPVASAG